MTLWHIHVEGIGMYVASAACGVPLDDISAVNLRSVEESRRMIAEGRTFCAECMDLAGLAPSDAQLEMAL